MNTSQKFDGVLEIPLVSIDASTKSILIDDAAATDANDFNIAEADTKSMSSKSLEGNCQVATSNFNLDAESNMIETSNIVSKVKSKRDVKSCGVDARSNDVIDILADTPDDEMELD